MKGWDRLEAVAQVHAEVTRPLSVDPKIETGDRIAASTFLAMFDAATKAEGYRPPTEWEREFDEWISEMGEEG
jgi:hypothetical protein